MEGMEDADRDVEKIPGEHGPQGQKGRSGTASRQVKELIKGISPRLTVALTLDLGF